MAMKKPERCATMGHVYDAAVHASCPMCRQVDQKITDTEGVDKFRAQTTNMIRESRTDDIDPKKTRDVKHDEQKRAKEHQKAETKQHQQKGDAGVKTVWAHKIKHPDDTKGINPVAGWLVCVKGGAKGRDFRVHQGMNAIGRDPGNAIQITGDETISRERHATITFDPKSRRFLVLNVNGQNLTYVNDNPALQVVEVQAYDRIQVGDTVLVFVPLVSDRFSWDEATA